MIAFIAKGGGFTVVPFAGGGFGAGLEAADVAGVMKNTVPVKATGMARMRKDFPESWIWLATFAAK